MAFSCRQNPALALAAAFLCAGPARAQKSAEKSASRAAALDPATLPARDSHQGLLVAVRPDDTLESSRAAFGPRNPYAAGILGLDVYFRNDNDLPIQINRGTVQLFIGAPGEKPQRLDALPHDQVADLILSTNSKDPTATRRTPVPGVGLRSAHDKNWQKLDDLLRAASLPGSIVPAHSLAHGYFFFDIDHQFSWLPGSHLDVPDVAFAAGSHAALLFFEIDLAAPAPATGGAP